MKMNFIIYLIKLEMSISPDRNLNPLSFAMHLRRYFALTSTTTITTHKNAVEVIKETSFFNKKWENPWKLDGVKKIVIKIWSNEKTS